MTEKKGNIPSGGGTVMISGSTSGSISVGTTNVSVSGSSDRLGAMILVPVMCIGAITICQ